MSGLAQRHYPRRINGHLRPSRGVCPWPWQPQQGAGNDLENFWILLKLDKEGAVKEVLLHPTTKTGTCARETLLKSTFSAPPRAAYWVSVYMKLTHNP